MAVALLTSTGDWSPSGEGQAGAALLGAHVLPLNNQETGVAAAEGGAVVGVVEKVGDGVAVLDSSGCTEGPGNIRASIPRMTTTTMLMMRVRLTMIECYFTLSI